MTTEVEHRYKKTAPSKKLISGQGFNHYRSLHKNKSKELLVESYPEFSLIARTIFKNVAKAMVEKPGGVFMRGLGYFCVWMSPVKMDQATIEGKDGKRISLMNFDEPYRYNPHLFVDAGGNKDSEGWSMERTFHRDIKTGVSANLRNYKPYTFHWSIIKRMFYS